MKNKKLKNILLALAMSLALVFTACGGSAPASESDGEQPQGETQQEQTTPTPAPYAPFVSQQVYDAYGENSDVIGWLTVDGCEIDNRVFQCGNNDFYLRLNEAGEYDVWGCYFLDYINVNDGYELTDKVNIIYGHALDDDPNSEKFSKLKRYKEETFAKANPTISFDLLYANTSWQIFAATDIPVTIDYIDPNPDEEKYTETLAYMVENSYVDFGVDVTSEDRILVLSTCTSDENIRFVVAAKLIE